jgi:hypothetical protein
MRQLRTAPAGGGSAPGGGAAYALSLRDLLLLGLVLLVPVPLFAVSGLTVPLPEIVQRMAASLLPGLDDDAGSAQVTPITAVSGFARATAAGPLPAPALFGRVRPLPTAVGEKPDRDGRTRPSRDISSPRRRDTARTPAPVRTAAPPPPRAAVPAAGVVEPKTPSGAGIAPGNGSVPNASPPPAAAVATSGSSSPAGDGGTATGGGGPSVDVTTGNEGTSVSAGLPGGGVSADVKPEGVSVTVDGPGAGVTVETGSGSTTVSVEATLPVQAAPVGAAVAVPVSVTAGSVSIGSGGSSGGSGGGVGPAGSGSGSGGGVVLGGLLGGQG